MRTATDGLNTLESSSGGMLKDTITSLDESLKSEDARIEAEQARVERFTRDLQERLAKADAMIAALEQQATYFNNMFEAMRTNQKSMS
jgi:flagellar capping protein FliD